MLKRSKRAVLMDNLAIIRGGIRNGTLYNNNRGVGSTLLVKGIEALLDKAGNDEIWNNEDDLPESAEAVVEGIIEDMNIRK